VFTAQYELGLKIQYYLYICIAHTVELFQSAVIVSRLTQHVNLLSKTHCTGDMFRLPSSHHQAYVNVRTITDHCAVISDRSSVCVRSNVLC
jgi:hypothetical protein